MNDYQPIDCDQHSVLELLAMHRTRVMASARQPETPPLSVEGTIRDVLTRDGAEYLILLDPSGNELSIRLDHLQSLSAADGALIWRQKNVTGD